MTYDDLHVIDMATAAREAGFDDVAEYREWLRLDGRRQLRLSLREEAEREAQMLDRGSEVHQSARLVDSERAFGLARCVDRCLRLYRRVTSIKFSHGFAPSVAPDSRSVEVSPAAVEEVAAGDTAPGGEG